MKSYKLKTHDFRLHFAENVTSIKELAIDVGVVPDLIIRVTKKSDDDKKGILFLQNIQVRRNLFVMIMTLSYDHMLHK